MCSSKLACNNRKRKAETQGQRDDDDSAQVSDDEQQGDLAVADLANDLWSNDHATVDAAIDELTYWTHMDTPGHLSNCRRLSECRGHANTLANLKESVSNVQRADFVQYCLVVLVYLSVDDDDRCEHIRKCTDIISISKRAMQTFEDCAFVSQQVCALYGCRIDMLGKDDWDCILTFCRMI